MTTARTASGPVRGLGPLLATAVRADPAERRRTRLLTVAVAGAGTLVTGAVAIAALRGDSDAGWSAVDGTLVPTGRTADLLSLSPYVAQSGLRGGVVLGALLLVVPFAALAVQVLRLGTAARERRLSAIRLAGATAADLRRIAAAEGVRPGLRGALLAGPAYLVLWLLLGVLPPAGSRLLPPLSAAVLLTWLVLVPTMAAASAAAAMLAVRAARVDPLGRARRAARPLTRVGWVVPSLLGTAVAAELVWLLLVGSSTPTAQLFLLLTLLVAAALSAGPVLVVLAGRWRLRRRSVTSVLAGRRLLADPRTPGRVAGVLLAVGLATGLAVGGIGSLLDQFLLQPGSYAGDLMFYLGGYLIALAGIGFAFVVAALSLTVGATEQVLDARRPTAALVGLGMLPAEVGLVLRRQLTAAAVLPAVLGTAVGWSLWLVGFARLIGGPLAYTYVALPLALLLAGASSAVGARLVARLVRAPLAEACSVESLRAA